MLNNFNIYENSKKRELYVAMTRAKNNLSIHLNNNILDGLNADKLKIENDNKLYPEQDTIVLQLMHKDVWLSFFNNKKRQYLMKKLRSGDKLACRDNTCFDPANNEILKFSKAFISKLEEIKTKGYAINEVRVNFILFWKNEDSDTEVKIILPGIYLTKQSDR
jgi:ATP-dependent DNA helicase RecQ